MVIKRTTKNGDTFLGDIVNINDPIVAWTDTRASTPDDPYSYRVTQTGNLVLTMGTNNASKVGVYLVQIQHTVNVNGVV